ncbi:hypothetical protein LBMAG42_19570 [Deltaproteobacteria bacterium]|nr:hypothetical protein LBMAG42_19570 [Deltaproteobacteria bacterium]
MSRSWALGLLLCVPALAFARSKPPPSAPEPVVAPAPPPDPLAGPPVVLPAVAFVPPAPEAAALTNQVPVWVIPSPTLPIFTIVVTVPGGSQLDAVGKEGTAALAMEAMRHGAGALSGPAFAAEVERRGLTIDGAAGADGSYLMLSGPSDQLAPGLDLLADLVLRPQLKGGEVKKARELLIAGLQQNLAEPAYVASRTANALYWGKDHPYGRPTDGTTVGLKKAAPGDVKRWHKAAWQSGGATITAAGDVSATTLIPLLNARFGAWAAGKAVLPSVPAAPAHVGEPIYLVDAPDSAQTGFYVAFPGLKIGAEAEATTHVGTVALGGTFTSRLNALLREKRGYTYGVRAAMESMVGGGTLVVRTRIRTDVTAPALVDLLGELDGIRKGITPEELVKAQGAARQDVVASLESQGGTAGLFAGYLSTGRPASALAAEMAAVAAVETAAVAPAMGAWDQAKAVFVLVGDRKVIEPALRELGFTNLTVVVPP